MISLEIYFARLTRHLRRKRWSWRLLIPADFLEVITNVLLVKRFLRAPAQVLVRRPEAGRIRRQNFVSQSNSLRRSPVLELRIRNDDAPLPRTTHSTGDISARITSIERPRSCSSYLRRDAGYLLTSAATT